MLIIASFAVALGMAALFGVGVSYILAARINRRLEAIEEHLDAEELVGEVYAFLDGQS